MQLEPEDTSEWDAAIEERAGELSQNADIIIDALHKVQERMNRQGIGFDLIEALDDELNTIALQQIESEGNEYEDSRLEDLADRAFGYKNYF